jgi:beta-barrel assembly-enhancing protease
MMKTWFATYIPNPGAEPVEATVLALKDHISIGYCEQDGTTTTISWNIKQIIAAFDRNLQATKIVNSSIKDRSLLINGKEACDFILLAQEEERKPWYKKQTTKAWLRSLSVFFVVAGILVATYFLFVPWLAEKLAANVSIKAEEGFGDAVFDALDLSQQEDKKGTMLLNDFFKEMKVPTQYNVRITAVEGDLVNAFALPGGHIIVYSALINELKTYPELAALLSHEFAHINNRHTTKSVFRQLGSGVFLSLLFGRFGNVTTVLAEHADKFKSLTYSRGLEKEADMAGLSLMKERKIDSEGFVRLFQYLKASATGSVMPEFFESHPDIDKRIAYVREASKNSQSEDNSALKTIFEELKNNEK